MKAEKLWPLAVVGVLAVTVIANAAMLLVAGDPSQRAIEPDYYRKAVAWDSTLAERARSAALGWTLDARLEPAAGGARLRVSLADAAGAPLAGARVRVTALHNLEADRPTVADCGESTPGAYEASLPLRRAGLWELRVEAVRGAERFTTSLRRELGRTP